jgi:hypothetical protein
MATVRFICKLNTECRKCKRKIEVILSIPDSKSMSVGCKECRYILIQIKIPNDQTYTVLYSDGKYFISDIYFTSFT